MKKLYFTTFGAGQKPAYAHADNSLDAMTLLARRAGAEPMTATGEVPLSRIFESVLSIPGGQLRYVPRAFCTERFQAEAGGKAPSRGWRLSETLNRIGAFLTLHQGVAIQTEEARLDERIYWAITAPAKPAVFSPRELETEFATAGDIEEAAGIISLRVEQREWQMVSRPKEISFANIAEIALTSGALFSLDSLAPVETQYRAAGLSMDDLAAPNAAALMVKVAGVLLDSGKLVAAKIHLD